ncbi:hypothetical protein C8R47DRAFT_457180 [Mycena vitilis]|nr:hypothetical protein C8R47DRAFT_457180 [Mycena vitilis]
MKRSGDQPVTFRLSYPCGQDSNGDDDEESPEPPERGSVNHYLLEYLALYARRWKDIHLQSFILPDDEVLGEDDEGNYPNLRSLAFSYSQLGSDDTNDVPCLEGIPWSQLTKYHEYECSWKPDDTRFWDIVRQLTNVVDLRAGFVALSRLDDPVRLPGLRWASFEIRRQREEEFTFDELLDDFDLPVLEGLNLKLYRDHPADVLYPIPDGLRALKTLRLCGTVKISKGALKHILTSIPTLTDLSVEMEGISGRCLFALLSYGNKDVTLVPGLQALRITPFDNRSGAFTLLLDMLRIRFEGLPVGSSPLRLFSFSTRLHGTPPLILDGLRALKDREGWDIRIDENRRRDFWREEMADAHV